MTAPMHPALPAYYPSPAARMIAAEIIGQVLDAGGVIELGDNGFDLVLTRDLPADLKDRVWAHKLDIVMELGAEEHLASLRTMSPHPMAALFPLMDGPAFADLRAAIAQHGLREPIVLHEGMVLDGRNRLRACVETGTPPVFREWDGPDPLAFVLDANLHRRHLDETQRAMVAARVSPLNRGRPAINTEISAFSQGRASELFNVSPDSIQFARKVLDRGTPELVAACDQGAVKVSAAAQLADADPAYQKAILEKVAEGLPVMEARRQIKRESLSTARVARRQVPHPLRRSAVEL